jgi:uncharacterized protein YceH (UPF0502 family)
METENILPQLSLEEQRVLGALIEKSKTTPDYYPMTLNGIVTACNQKSSRNPVVDFDEETVVSAIDSLKKKHLAANVIGGGSRAIKYRHSIAVTFPLDPAETSVICLLLLRGPLTPGEINSNSGRLHDFDSLDEVISTIDGLMNSETPFIKLLPKKPGQKEARYCHLFGDNFSDESEEKAVSKSNLEERLATVESELAELKEAFANLLKELGV